jgi:hypothetical protein
MVMEAYPRGCNPCGQHWREDHDSSIGAGQACRGQAHRGEVNPTKNAAPLAEETTPFVDAVELQYRRGVKNCKGGNT